MQMSSLQGYLRQDSTGTTQARVEERLEPFMLGLSLLFALVFCIPLLTEISPEAESGLELAGWAIWLLFLIEYAWLLLLADDRPHWARNHKLDLLIIILPFLRTLRFVRVIRVATTTSGLGRALISLQRIGARPGFQPVFVALFSFILVGSGFVLAFEHEQPSSSIQSFGDALWWAIVTCSTVGYGDQFPVTLGGRIVAVVLMLVGIGGLTLVTATIAAFFVNQDDDQDQAELRLQLDRIEALLLTSRIDPITSPLEDSTS